MLTELAQITTSAGVDMKVLYSAGELLDSIQEVLASPDAQHRRVALVAFVGVEAERD